MKLLTIILVTLLLLSTCTYTAKADRVFEGYIITVLTDNKEQIRLRLEGMDKVELPDNSRKQDLYIGNMVRLCELDNSV
jgi:endonuclease YncB( thermonuclease family)